MKMDEARRAFVSDCASRFVNEFLGEQLLFHSKGKAKKKNSSRRNRGTSFKLKTPSDSITLFDPNGRGDVTDSIRFVFGDVQVNEI